MKHNQYTFEGSQEQMREFSIGARSRFGFSRRVLIVVLFLGPMMLAVLFGLVGMAGVLG